MIELTSETRDTLLRVSTATLKTAWVKRGFRDTLQVSARDMPTCYNGPCAPTNLTKQRAIAINDPVARGGVFVCNGNAMVKESVVGMPAKMAEEMAVLEGNNLEKAQDGASKFGVYPSTALTTKETFATWRQSKKI